MESKKNYLSGVLSAVLQEIINVTLINITDIVFLWKVNLPVSCIRVE